MDAETVVASLDEPVCTLDTDGQITFVNERFLEVYQVSESSVTGSSYAVFDDFVVEGFESLSEAIERVRQTETAVTAVELSVEHPPSAPVPRQVRAVANVKTVNGAEGVLIAVRYGDREVGETSRKRVTAVERAHQQLRQIIDLVPDPLFVKSLDDEILLSNEANAELHGMTPEEIEGRREVDIEPEVENIDNFDKYRQREREVIETGKPRTFEEELMNPDGERHVFKITRIPFQTRATEEDAVLGYARDVTDLKQYEQELEETKRTLEQSNEKLDQFAGIVSHDLRNPLNAAQLYLDLLRRENRDDHIDELDRSLGRMESMIENLLALARAGASVDNPQQVSLAAVATESWETARTDDADLDVSVAESSTVLADRNRLRHVFENLFRNTVDHNKPPLTVRVGTVTDGFYVEDNGVGIPEEEHDNIFEHGYTTSDDGTGFGLSIVEDIVDAHDWTVSVTESQAGGARFEITGVEVDD